MWPISGRANADSETGLQRFDDVSVSSKGAQVPGKLLSSILEYLRPEREDGPFEPLLARCSLTCRHWAVHIRPHIFRRVHLTSEKRVRAFSALARSSVVVPAPLRETVRHLVIEMDNISRPWLYHAWALSSSNLLPKVEETYLFVISKADSDERLLTGSPVSRRKSEVLLDIGLPRKLPSTRPLVLHTLYLHNLWFRSRASFFRSFDLHSPSTVRCTEVRWPDESPVVPAGRLKLHRLEAICTKECTAVMPFIQGLVTTQQPSPRATQQLLHIHGTQIDAVMGIFRLFSDECECRQCQGTARTEWYKLYIYPGAPTY